MLWSAAMLATFALLAGCQTASKDESSAAPQKEKQVVKVDKDGVQRIRLVGGSYFFKPNHIVVKANVPVELLASREGGVTPHNLVIKAPEAGIAIEQDLATEPK